MEIKEFIKQYTLEEYLLAANELADKWNLSQLSVVKFASWISLEAGKNVHNNNPLNIRPISSDNFYYNSGKVNEIINGKVIWADPNNPKDPIRKFKSYNTLGEGIENGLTWLNNHHKPALSYLLDDNKSAKEFALKLGEPDNRGLHYYLADKELYSNGVQIRFEQILKIV